MLTWAKAIRSSLWQLWANFWMALMTFLSGSILARMLGVSSFGQLSYIVTYVTVFVFLGRFGIDGVLSRELSKRASALREQKFLKAGVKLQGWMAGITYAVLFLTAYYFEEDPEIRKGIIIMGLILFTRLPQLLEFVYNSRQRGGYIAFAKCVSITAGTAGKWISLHLGFGINGVLWVSVAEALLASLIFLFGNPGVSLSRLAVKGRNYELMIVKHAWPLFISSAAIVLYQRVDVMMLKSMSTFDEIGQYSVGNKFAMLVNLIPLSLSSALSPLIFNARVKGLAVYKHNAQLFIDICFWGAMLPCILFYFSAPFLVPFLFGSSYLPAIYLSQISIWRSVFSGMGVSTGKMILAENLQHIAIYRTFGGLLVNIFLNYLWIPSAGSIGAAYATLISFVIANFLLHAVIPAFRHLLLMQLRAVFFGLHNILHQQNTWKNDL